jgi:hypothetical protein
VSVSDAPQPERPPAGIPGWRRAPCLGCGATLKETRPPWVTLVGTRDGALLLAYPLGPERAQSTFDPLSPPRPLFILGVAHRECLDLARARLIRREVDLADVLPDAQIGEAPELLGTRGMPHADAERCPFCWNTKELTEEDVLPLWLQRHLASLAGQPGQLHPNPWPKITVPVCARCNNGWLSVLENDVSRIIKPTLVADSAMLSEPERAVVATWAAKIALLLDCYGTNPVVPHEYLKALATDSLPGPSTGVWLAARTGNVAMQALFDVVTETDSQGSHQPTGIKLTFSIGYLVFLVIVRFGGAEPFPIPSRLIEQALLPLWPAAPGSARWPAGNFSFGDDGAARLREMSDPDWVPTTEPPENNVA